MYEVSGELTVIVITIWRLQKLGKEWQHGSLLGKELISGN